MIILKNDMLKERQSSKSHVTTLILIVPGCISMNLEFFIPPLMWRAFKLTITNICFDQPLACRSQFHNEGVGTKILSFQQFLRRSTGCKVEVTKLEQLKKLSSSLDLDDEMDVDPQQKYTHMYKIGKHTCEDLIFQI